MNDPMEAIIAAALRDAKEPFVTDFGGKNPSGLDFRLTAVGVEIEVKQFHSPRISEQMSRSPNVIAIQGRGAVEYFADLIRRASQQIN